MPQLFTVRWPFLAWTEAIVFVPFALRAASEIEPIRNYVDHALVPVLAPVRAACGLSEQTLFWIAMACVVIIPYFVALLVADRLLTVRKGYFLLSVFAIMVWAATARILAWMLVDYLPESMLAGSDLLSFEQEVGLAIGGIAVVLHAWPLWVGARDEGEVAMRLLDRGDYRYAHAGRAGDVYYQRTAAFREWRPQQQFEGLRDVPKENPAVKLLSAATWAGIIIGTSTAWLNWKGYIDLRGSRHLPESAPAVAAGPMTPGAAAKAGTPVPVPVVQSAANVPQTSSHVVAAAPLPTVFHPTERSSSVQTPDGAISGPNEAVAERGNDGSFAFDAVVNGTHVKMIFDTGASVVGLKAEDAVRMGIPVTRLNYSAQIKTANGTAEVAPVMIDRMVIGNITLHGVPGFVAKQGMLAENLLGQTFLSRLAGFDVENNLLVLRGR